MKRTTKSIGIIKQENW